MEGQNLFEEFSADNAHVLDAQYAESKKPPKAPKASKEPKAPKAPSLSTINQSRKLLEKSIARRDSGTTAKNLRVINQLKTHFEDDLKGKYKKLSFNDDPAEIEAQLHEIWLELRCGNSIPSTKAAFKKGATFLEYLSTNYFPAWGVPLNLTHLGKVVSNEDTFSDLFEKPLTALAIKHDLFASEPLTVLITNLSQLILGIHVSNLTGQSLAKEAPAESKQERYDDL